MTEQTTAGYVSGVYTRAKLKLQAGLRYDSTTDDLGSYQQVSNNVYQPQTSRSGCNKLLPSGVASYTDTGALLSPAQPPPEGASEVVPTFHLESRFADP